MKLPPTSVLESWPAPNYKNPVTRGNSLVILNTVFLGVMTAIIILRLYTRLFVRRWFGWDDVFIVVAFISTVLMNVAVDIGSLKYGWNRHEWDIPLSMSSGAFKVAYFAKLPFLFAGFFTAQSLLSFYYRLIKESGVRWFRIALHCAVVFNIASWLPFVFAETFVCYPIYAYWTFPEPAGAKCLNEPLATMVGGVVKVCVDLLITTLPIPLVLNMNMQRRQRYIVACLLGLGYLVTAAGAIRVYYTWKTFYDTNDMSWFEYPAFIASSIENNLAVICACVPTIRPLFPHLFGGPVSKLRNWMSSKSSSNQNSADDQTTSHGSRTNRVWPKPSLGSKQQTHEDPFPAENSSSDTKLVIQRNQSFELTEKSVYEEATPTESQRPDYYSFNRHFDSRQEERRTRFNAI